jgi:uncharacterized protein YutD
MILNFYNAEELIFNNNQVQKLLPEFKHLFDSWKLAARHPELRGLGKRSVVDFLENLTTDHSEKLSKYFDDTIKINTINYHIVKNFESNIDSIDLQGAFPNISSYRRGDHLYISSWR